VRLNHHNIIDIPVITSCKVALSASHFPVRGGLGVRGIKGKTCLRAFSLIALR
jgi:hypothetical protein